MSLENELILIQFAQGFYPKARLLDSFRQLDETSQYKQLFDLTALLKELKPTDDEIEQTNARSSSDAPANSFLIQRTKLSKVSIRINIALVELEKSYAILLDLVTMAYPRGFDQEKDSPNNWLYRDLSNNETVQSILAQHHARVAELYSSTSFRSEFVSLAKLWHRDRTQKEEQYRKQEPVDEPQTYVDFLTYDELMTTSLPVVTISNESRAIDILLRSLQKATSIRYKLEPDQASRLVLDVLRRHLWETYNRQLDL